MSFWENRHATQVQFDLFKTSAPRVISALPTTSISRALSNLHFEHAFGFQASSDQILGPLIE